MATIYDVAQLAGVSPKTVSRVLNRDAAVRDNTRTAVEKAMAELRNIGAKALHALGHDSYIFLMRNGTNAGKSISHLHQHLMPEVVFAIEDADSRKILDTTEIESEIEVLQSALLG